MLGAGARLGPYEVVSPLGAGGMVRSIAPATPAPNRTVVLKLLPAEFRDQPGSALTSKHKPFQLQPTSARCSTSASGRVMEHRKAKPLTIGCEDRSRVKEVLLCAQQIDALDRARAGGSSVTPATSCSAVRGADFGRPARAVEVTA